MTSEAESVDYVAVAHVQESFGSLAILIPERLIPLWPELERDVTLLRELGPVLYTPLRRDAEGACLLTNYETHIPRQLSDDEQQRLLLWTQEICEGKFEGCMDFQHEGEETRFEHWVGMNEEGNLIERSGQQTRPTPAPHWSDECLFWTSGPPDVEYVRGALLALTELSGRRLRVKECVIISEIDPNAQGRLQLTFWASGKECSHNAITSELNTLGFEKVFLAGSGNYGFASTSNQELYQALKADQSSGEVRTFRSPSRDIVYVFR